MGLTSSFMKLVSWYDNEWGYRYTYYLASTSIFRLSLDAISCNNLLLILFFVQQPSTGPDRTHGIGSGCQLNMMGSNWCYNFFAIISVKVEYKDIVIIFAFQWHCCLLSYIWIETRMLELPNKYSEVKLLSVDASVKFDCILLQLI